MTHTYKGKPLISYTQSHSVCIYSSNWFEGGGMAEIRKPKFLCLHGQKTSGHILKTQLQRWPKSILDKLDLVFPDAPFPFTGKVEVEGIYDPPYYEWFQFSKDYTEYTNFDECLAYIEDLMIKHGPFDGLLGFSQGSILAAALPALQAKGVALSKVPYKIKFLIIIGGAKFSNKIVAAYAYSAPIQCTSVHFLGDRDYLRPYGAELIECFVDPVVIHHPKGHTVPRLDEKGVQMMLGFLERIQKEMTRHEEQRMRPEKVKMSSGDLKCVIVAVDSSEESMNALNWAIQNVKLQSTDGHLLILHVQSPPSISAGLNPGAIPFGGPTDLEVPAFNAAIEKHQQRISEAVINHAAKICSENNVNYKTRVVVGDPKEKICEVVEGLHADLLVIGCRSFGPIKRMFLGSVSNYCSNHVPSPVMIVKKTS